MRMFFKWGFCLSLLLLAGCASFTLTAEPIALVYDDEGFVALTPYSFKLMTGERSFVLKRKGYVEKDLHVTSIDLEELHFRLEKVEGTPVDTLPHGAKVVREVDGEVLGITPCDLQLSRGESVLVRLKGFEMLAKDLIPNKKYTWELKPKGGFQSAFYQDIHFSSQQGAVDIYDRVAGEKIGTTPAVLTLVAGSELEYRLPDHQPGYALISKNSASEIKIELEKIPYKTIITTPIGASIYRVGGQEPLGESPFVLVVDSERVLEIRKQGYVSRSIGLGADSPAEVQVSLLPIPQGIPDAVAIGPLDSSDIRSF